MKQYDAIIIGSGQAGTPLAKKLARAGWKTALIEKRTLGGTCVNDGCTPTKSMIGAARTIYMASRAQAFGVVADTSKVDITAVLKRKNDLVAGSVNSITDVGYIIVFVHQCAGLPFYDRYPAAEAAVHLP